MQKCYLLFLLLFTSELSFSQTIVFKGKVTWLDLIVNLKSGRNEISEEDDLQLKMALNGNVVFNDASILLSSKKEEPLFLMFDELELKNTILETNGNTITLICNKLCSNNSFIVSYLPHNMNSQDNGKSGGLVRIIVLESMHGKLNVFLDGQNGAYGKNGYNSDEEIKKEQVYTVNSTFRDIDRAYDKNVSLRRRTFRTKKERSSNSYRTKSNATNGSNGGNGGDGGTLILYKTKATDELFKNQFHFTGFAGKIGLGGIGGKGLNSDNEKTKNGNDGLEGKPGFMKIEIYNFEDLFINH